MIILNKLMANKPEGDRFCQYPERALIYSFYNISYNALRLFLVIAGQKNGFEVDTDILCSRANLNVNEYNQSLDELINKGYLILDDEVLKVNCPTTAYNMNFDKEELNIKDEDYDF